MLAPSAGNICQEKAGGFTAAMAAHLEAQPEFKARV